MAEAEAIVLEYIEKWVPDPKKAPLGGNSVGTDRVFLARDMPNIVEHLHYRVIDVSTIKELSRRWFPRAYFQSPPNMVATARSETSRTPSTNCVTTARQSSSRPLDLTLQRHSGFPSKSPVARRRRQLRDLRHLFGKFHPKGRKWQNHLRRRGIVFVVAFAADGSFRKRPKAHGGRSSVGRAPGCGPGGRGFNPVAHPHEIGVVRRSQPKAVLVIQCGLCFVQADSGHPVFRTREPEEHLT